MTTRPQSPPAGAGATTAPAPKEQAQATVPAGKGSEGKGAIAVRPLASGSMWWLSLLSVTVFLVFWYAIVRFGIISEALLASPEQVLTTFISKLTNRAPDGATLGANFRTSLKLCLIGYISAVCVGVPLGLIIGWFRKVDEIVKPLFEMIRPIPPIAWIPLAILWLIASFTSGYLAPPGVEICT